MGGLQAISAILMGRRLCPPILARYGCSECIEDDAVEPRRPASRAGIGNDASGLEAEAPCRNFHLELCRLSNNSYLLDHARKVLLPFFAFVRIRVMSSGQDTAAWSKDFEAHQRIVDLVKEGQGEVAEAYVQRMMARFALTAYDNWEKKPVPLSRTRRRSSPTAKKKKK
jgi:DNA-binding FadR family transcriptional regulator